MAAPFFFYCMLRLAEVPRGVGSSSSSSSSSSAAADDDPAAPSCASLGWDEGWLGHSGRVNPGQDMTGCLLSNHQQPGAPDPAACRAACCNDTRCRSWGLDLRHPGSSNGCADGTPCCWLERCVGLSAASKSNCSWGCVSGRSGRADDPQQCGKCTDTSCACCGASCSAPRPLPPSPPHDAKTVPEHCSNSTGGYIFTVTNRSLGPRGGAIISKANSTSDFACASCVLFDFCSILNLTHACCRQTTSTPPTSLETNGQTVPMASSCAWRTLPIIRLHQASTRV